jgi:ankyrin repeat protein
MTAPSRVNASNLLLLPPEIIQIIVDYQWPHETISLLIAVPKLANLVTDKQLRYRDVWGYTILHRAIDENAEAIVNLIVRRCAQDQVATCQGYTPLHLAISGGRNKIAKMLVDAGFDLSSKNLGGKSPLHFAYSQSGRNSNFAEIVQLMLAKGADPSIIAKFQETILHATLRADQKPNLTVIQMVIDAGVDVNALDIDGFSPLWVSVTNGHEDAFELLLTHGADPHIQTFHGTILHEAVAFEREKLVKRAVELGVDLSVRDHEAETALMVATCYGSDNIAQILRNADCCITDVQTQGKFGVETQNGVHMN